MDQREAVRKMAEDIEQLILTDFPGNKHQVVKKMLEELHLTDVMAASEWNLLNARKAILTLAEGKLDDIPELVKAAKVDFRDVIYWVWQKNNPEQN